MSDSHEKKVTRRDALAVTAALGVCPLAQAQQPAPPAGAKEVVRRPPPATPPGPVFVPTDAPNQPIGVGKGIYPGRVVWAHRPEACHWDGETKPLSVVKATGEWWDDANCDPKIVSEMFSTSLRSLTGKKSDKKAWEALFKHFNKTRNLGSKGYQPGEKISIKVNMNNDRSNKDPWPSGRGMPSPQGVHALLRGLVVDAGVPGKDITVYDATNDRYIGDPVYQRIMSDPDPRMHEIVFECNTTRAANGRRVAEPDMNVSMNFTDPEVMKQCGPCFLPKSVIAAKYRINYALLRAHGVCGVTLCAKNNNGSLFWPKSNYWGPRVLHNFFRSSRPMGSYNAFVDYLGHKHLFGKTLLYLIDGLYAAEQSETNIVRFASFGNHWTASFFMSQDPVAIDSVGLDFIRNEPNSTPVRGNADNYLHEAALVDDPPSKIKYDPNGDGVHLTSLGVHEHWNNPKDKKYSRNLGTGKGIELVAV